MNIKEILINIRGALSINNNYEFNANLKSHKLRNQDIYRLYYIEFTRSRQRYGNKGFNVHLFDWPFDTFKLPEGMNREDAFKVLSYLTDYIEKSPNIKVGSFESVRTLDSVINLERLGFKKIFIDAEKNQERIVDLFTVNGRALLFKYSKYYPRYVEWYTKGVTLEEVKEIYDKIGKEFYDLIPEENNMKPKRLIYK